MFESLEVWGSASVVHPEPIDFFDYAPNLHELRLIYYTTRGIFTHHRLTHLEVIFSFQNVTLCLDTLRSTPNLVELMISFNQWHDEAAVPSHPRPKISVRLVEKIHSIAGKILDDDPELDALFDHLETPNLRRLSLTYGQRYKLLTEPSFLSFLQRSPRSLACLEILSNDEASDHDEEGPDVKHCLGMLSSITTPKLRDEHGHWLISTKAMGGLTLGPDQTPLLPILEELEIECYDLDIHAFAKMVESNQR